jgi:mannose-6-phosphate isomerase
MESCLTFDPLYKERIWGGRELETVFGRALPRNATVGESWELVDRAADQSVVNDGEWRGRTLHELWLENRAEVFGENCRGNRFPLLVKILDTAEALSVQVHPPLEVAQTLAGEPKTEVWYFVRTATGAGIYAGLKPGVDRQSFERALHEGVVEQVVHRLATEPHAFIYIPSGRLHAIDAGNLIFEIQQNSDTTFRVFDWNRVGPDGKKRELHVTESLACIDFDDHAPSLGSASGEQLVHCDHFRIERWHLREGRPANDERAFAVFQCVQGRVATGGREFGPGDLFFIPAAYWSEKIQGLTNDSIVLRTRL